MPQNDAVRQSAASMSQTVLALAPTVLGLMIARMGLIVSAYGSYSSTDQGIYTDGSSILAMLPLFIFMCILGKTRIRLVKKHIFVLTSIAIAVQAASIIALGVVLLAGNLPKTLSFGLSVIITLSSYLSIFYWLRRARGASSSSAVTIAFGSLLLSEPLIYLASLMPHGAACLAVGLLTLAQFICQKYARRRPLVENIHAETTPLGYFGFAERMIDGVRPLAILALGMLLLSFAVGILRCFPDGSPIPFSPATRVAYMALEMLLFAALIWRSFRGSRSVMTTSIWVILEASGVIALICYAFFPNNLAIGAIFTTVFNAGMTGFMWYLVVAFSSFGNRDPYYYAIAGWMVFMVPRAIARILMEIAPGSMGDTPLFAIVAALIAANAQLVFVQIIWIERTVSNEKSSATAKSIRTLLGLDDAVKEDPASIRRALMQDNTKQMQNQFLLSDRETDVLTLYAMGLTQRKIAEELCISPGTTHTHIKRIYIKTDLHSRQEILDYIERYTG